MPKSANIDVVIDEEGREDVLEHDDNIKAEHEITVLAMTFSPLDNILFKSLNKG